VYSYCIEAQAEDLDMIKKNVLYNKAIKRYVIFKMDKNDDFALFEKVNAELNAVIETWDAKKL
jgi:hypothetical protein